MVEMITSSLLARLRGRPYLVAGLAVLFLASVIAGAFVTAGRREQAALVERVVTPIVEPVVPAPAALFGKQRIHLLVLGRDYDYTANDVEYSKESRSDIIMAFTLDFPTHTITELSVPRDTAVTLPGGSREKINSALSAGGVPEATAVIARYLGVTFDRYALLRIDSTKRLIDGIGGIDVPVHRRVDYDDSWGHLHIHLAPGVHHLNGDQAVSYARFRHDWCGDPCRIARQQDVLHVIATKLRDDKLNDLLHARELISIVRDDVTTNLSSRELLSMAWAFRQIDPHAIQTAQVPYTGQVTLADGDALVPDDAAKVRLVNRLMLGPFGALAARHASRKPAAAIAVEVRNGTESDAPAKALDDRLKGAGFKKISVASADRLDYSSSEIRVSPGASDDGAAVRTALGPRWQAIPIVEELPPGSSDEVEVVLGSDQIASP
ncbi:MAG: LCP family protein [Candidatus Baltobacteraceae bacterium]